jgi:hypothetical protein
MRLWLTTSSENFASEFDDIEAMFAQGLTRLILQKRGKSGSLYATESEYERWLLSLPMECRDRIWVRGTPDMAERLEVRGCVTDASSLLGEVPERWKRVNTVAFCRRPEELEALPEWVSGALIGPVFQPQSIYEPVENLGIDRILNSLENEKASRISQIIVFGGIDQDCLESLKTLPIHGISVLGGIWNYADPVNAFIKLNRAICFAH